MTLVAPAAATTRTPSRARPETAVLPVLPVLAVLATSAAVAAIVAWGAVSLAVVAAWPVFAVAAAHDARTGRLPMRLTRMGGALALVPVVITAVTHGWQPAGAALAGASSMVIPVLVLHLAAPAAMGFGDVAFAAAAGVGVGLLEWRLGVLALAIASLGAVASALLRGGGRHTTVAFGPALLGGVVVAVGAAAVASLGGTPLLGWEVATWR